MKKRRIIGIIVLLFIGIIIIGFITGVLTTPSIKNISNRWGNISDNTTEIITSIQIENSNPFKITIPRVEVDYKLKMNNIEMSHGTFKDINLKKGISTVEVTTYFNNSKIPEWWVSHLRNNETTIVDIEPAVVFDLEFSEPNIKIPSKTISIETNLIRNIDNIDEKTITAGPIELVFNPYSADWGNISNETTEILLDVVVTNTFNYTIFMPEINYTINMNNITIGNGKIKDLIVLKDKNETVINLVTEINNNLLDNWFVSHLQNNENSTFEIFINSTINYKGVNYKIKDFVIYTQTFDTDILGSAL